MEGTTLRSTVASREGYSWSKATAGRENAREIHTTLILLSFPPFPYGCSVLAEMKLKTIGMEENRRLDGERSLGVTETASTPVLLTDLETGQEVLTFQGVLNSAFSYVLLIS